MIDALVSGRLHGKVTERMARNGSKFATAVVRVAMRDGTSVFVNIICFSAAMINSDAVRRFDDKPEEFDSDIP